MSQNPILVERYRGEVLESFHRGVICMVDDEGKIIFSEGDVNQICFPRSAMKFFQVMPLLESGAVEKFGFTMKEIALMCGSHNGEAAHVEGVEGILKKIGLSKDDLQCGCQYPTLTEDRNALIKSDTAPECVHNNCSGKHAGFLALCVYAGYDIKSYLDPEHPIHKMIKSVVAEMNEYPEEKLGLGLDGCSAPVFSLPVYNQALGYKNLVNPKQFSEKRQKSCKTIIEAVTTYPYMVAGKERYCTQLMEQCHNRIIGKTGADGVYSLAFIDEKIGCVIKIDDGQMGPQYAVAQAIVNFMDVCTKQALDNLHEYIEAPLLNWNKRTTGITRVNPEIVKALKDTLSKVL